MRTLARVTWFDPATGEGAAVSEGGARATLTQAVLAPHSLVAVPAGTLIDCEVRLTASGLAVTSIYNMNGEPAAPGQLQALAARHGPLRVRGRVQWFDPARGYGFVAADDVDLLLPRRVLDAAGLAAIGAGAAIECDAVRMPKGFFVSRLHAVLEAGLAVAPLVEAVPVPWEDGECRWYSRPKGYGFVTLIATREDVFVRGSALRRGGLRELRQAQRVRVQVERDSQRGAVAASVAAA
jgi:CspA family cold shock protein